MCVFLALGFLAISRSQRIVLEAAMRGPAPRPPAEGAEPPFATLTTEAKAWELLL